MGVFAELNPNVAASIVAAVATITVSVITVVVGRKLEANALLRKEHREKKSPVYRSLLSFMAKVLASAGSETPVNQGEVVAFMTKFTPKMMVWGSDDVIAKWRKFLAATIEASKSEPESEIQVQSLFHYEELIYAIRRDLGHKNKGLGQGTILGLFVTDISSYLGDGGKARPSTSQN